MRAVCSCDLNCFKRRQPTTAAMWTCQLQSLWGHRCFIHRASPGSTTPFVSTPRPLCPSDVRRADSQLSRGWKLHTTTLPGVGQQQAQATSRRQSIPFCKAASAAVASPAEQTSAATQLLDQLTADSSNQCLLQVSQEGEVAKITASRDIPAGKVSLKAQAYFELTCCQQREVTCCSQELLLGWYKAGASEIVIYPAHEPSL